MHNYPPLTLTLTLSPRNAQGERELVQGFSGGIGRVGIAHQRSLKRFRDTTVGTAHPTAKVSNGQEATE
jgi:hypothetical protein